MSGLLALSRVIDAANTFIGKAVSWLILLAIIISAVNATVRKVFNVSSNAWLEAQWYLFSAGFLVAAGYTLLNNEHVKVDLIYGRLSRRKQLWIEILGTLFFLFPFCLITIYLSWPRFTSKLISISGSILWSLFERVQHEALHVLRNRSHDPARRMRRIVRVLLRDLGARRTGEWRHSGQHLIENHTQAVDVCSGSEFGAAVLLG